jgi:PKD repeat protein
VHRRAHQAKDLRNVVPSFAHRGRNLLVLVLVALVAACVDEQRSTGPQDLATPVVPAPAPADANARLVLNDAVPDSLKALSRNGGLDVAAQSDGSIAVAIRGARVLASSLANLVTGSAPLVTATAIPFAPESGTPANLGPACDDCVMIDVPIGFSFSFFGNRYDKLDISSNGFVRFGTAPTRTESGCCSGAPIPRADNASLNNLIAVAWTDWRANTAGRIRYETRGTAPNRRFIVQYTDVPSCCTETSAMRLTAQLILYEGTGVAEVHTTSLVNANRAMTQGIENETGTVAAFLPGRVATVFTLKNDAVRFTTQRPNSLPMLAAGGNAGSPADHYEGEEGSAIQFAASANDPDGDVLSYSWDFENDGTVDATTASASHVYVDNGDYTAKVTVNDGQGGVAQATVPVHVTNAAPSVNAGSDLIITAGDVVPLEAVFHDAGQRDYVWSYTVLWGDDAGGVSSSTGSLDGQQHLVLSHRYNVPGDYHVTVRITDKDGAEGSSSLTVTANNRAPVAVAGGNAGGPPADRYSGVEGQAVSFDASASSDPDGDALNYSWSFGDRSADAAGARVEHVFGDNGSYVATLTVTDGRGGSNTVTVPVAITNANPVATLVPPSGELLEGSAFNLSLTGAIDVAADMGKLRYAFDCGNGFAAATASPSAACTPNDNGSLTVRGRVEDADGGASEYVASVTVANVAPTGVFTTPARVTVGSPIVLGFSSSNDASAVDRASLRYEFDCGTGAGFSPDAVCQTPAVGARRVSGRVVDKDGGQTTYGPYGVSIEPAATSLAVSNVGAQYSDPTSLNAILTSSAGAAAGPLAGTIDFTVDGASVGSAPVPNGGTVNLGPLTLAQSVGSHALTATFTPSSGNYTSSSSVGTLTVAREDVSVQYTGDVFVGTTGSPTATAAVRLAAALTQDADGSAGDLSLARVNFELFSSTNTGTTPDQVVSDVPVDRAGNAQTSVTLAKDNWTVRVTVPASNGYWIASQAAVGTVTVDKGGKGRRVSGGGSLTASTGKRTAGYFSFDVASDKKNSVKGDAQLVVDGGDGSYYLVKASSWSGASLTFSSDLSRATFTTKATLQKLDKRSGKAVSTSSSYVLTIDAVDGGQRSPKSADRIAYMVRDNLGRIWHQVGTQDAPVAIGDGKVTVRVE